jgi:hypothetical protein
MAASITTSRAASNQAQPQQKKPPPQEAASYPHCALHYGLTRNGLLLVSVPLGVVTVTKPVVAPVGTVAVR